VLATAIILAVLGMPAGSAAAADDGMLRLAHLSPDTPAVDVYVDSVSTPGVGITLPGVGYGAISDYQTLPAGTYAVSMRSAGAAPDSPPVLSTTVEVRPSAARTVAGVGRFADFRLSILDDELTLPPPGQARVRLISAAASAVSIAASVGGNPLSPGLDFGSASGYLDVPGGATTVQVTPSGGPPTTLPVTLAPGSVYSLVVLDRSGGGLTLSPTLDAASPGVVPVGGVEAGAGGTAPPAGGLPGEGTAAAALAALVLAVLLLAGRLALPRRGRRPAHLAR
jgi:hypothetical protein